MITAWILIYGLNTGAVVVYNVYTAESVCRAQQQVLRTIVRQPVECVAVELPEKGPAE